MYLKHLTITNYKSFLEPTEFSFEPGFNVLLGANSSGKTSVLEAICFRALTNTPHRSRLSMPEVDSEFTDISICELDFSVTFVEARRVTAPASHFFIGLSASHNLQNQGIPAVFQSHVSREPLLLGIKSVPAANSQLRLSFEKWPSAWRNLNGAESYLSVQIRCSDGEATGPANFGIGNSDILQFWEKLPPRMFKLSSERTVQATYGHHPNGELLPNGANLAYCINHLQSNNKHLFDTLNSLLHRVFPTIHWVGAPPNGSGGFELKVHTNPSQMNRGDLAVPISQVGTGVGNALAMLYVALTAQTERFILLEEPNSYLHPRALRELLAILTEIGGKHQFFVTTHSSDVLRTIQASTVTLLEYDGCQTRVKQTDAKNLHKLHAGLVDLGIRLTDLHGCDKVLWVEGETETAVFPILLRHFCPRLAEGVAVLPLHSTGDFEAKKFSPEKVAGIYQTLSEASFLAPPMVGILLDRERRRDSDIERIEADSGGSVQFLPRTMLEDYFLHAGAIAAALSTELARDVTSIEVNAVLNRAKTSKDCMLNPGNPVDTSIHAAKVLKFVFNEIGTIVYHKTAHGPKIAEWIAKNASAELTELKHWFEKLLRVTESKQVDHRERA